MAEGYDGEHATMADWTLHLTTLFPEVRLKSYIEVRSADSQPVELMLGTPALMKGVFYDEGALDAALDLVRGWSPADLRTLHSEAARNGLSGRVGRMTLGDYAKEFVAIARGGLASQAQTNSRGLDETIYLDRLEEYVRASRNPASLLIDRWEGEWKRNIDALVFATAYR